MPSPLSIILGVYVVLSVVTFVLGAAWRRILPHLRFESAGGDERREGGGDDRARNDDLGSRHRGMIRHEIARALPLAVLVFWAPLPFASVAPFFASLLVTAGLAVAAVALLTARALTGPGDPGSAAARTSASAPTLTIVPVAALAAIALLGALQSFAWPAPVARGVAPAIARAFERSRELVPDLPAAVTAGDLVVPFPVLIRSESDPRVGRTVPVFMVFEAGAPMTSVLAITRQRLTESNVPPETIAAILTDYLGIEASP